MTICGHYKPIYGIPRIYRPRLAMDGQGSLTMTQPDKQVTQSACRALLKPVVSFLLKCGLTWREFAAISKSVFVEVASREYGLRGRPTNISRVAILTGIGRKDVKKLREEEAGRAPERADKATGATAVLSGWHQDPDFLDAHGKPRMLSAVEGAGSFVVLCERYAGDIPAVAMLKELRRVGAIVERNGNLTVTSRSYTPAQSDPQWVMSAAHVFQDLGNNLTHNLDAGEDQPSEFLGRAMNSHIRASDAPAFRNFLEEQGQGFLEKVDDWLTEHSAESDSKAKQVRLGIGLFAIQGDNDYEQVEDND